MTYNATLKVQFTSTYTPSAYSSYETDTLPEENYTFEVPANDLTSTQVFGFFKKVMLTMGFDENVIASGMMSTVFNPDGDENQMRKLCEEYDLIMAEDFGKTVQEEVQKQLEIEEELKRVKKGPMGTVMGDLSDDDNMPPWGHSDMEAMGKDWKDLYLKLHGRFKDFMQFTDEELNQMVENHNSIPATPGSYRKLYQENLDLKAKLSRLENPDAPQYTDEEIEAMCSEESGMN
jgi:hypothetical protein